MDLVETNDGSGESDPLTATGDSRTLNGGGGSSGGGSNPSHSQASSGSISIVHVSVPQAQVSRSNNLPLISCFLVSCLNK